MLALLSLTMFVKAQQSTQRPLPILSLQYPEIAGTVTSGGPNQDDGGYGASENVDLSGLQLNFDYFEVIPEN